MKFFEYLIALDIVDETTLMLDSTTVKIHQHEAALKRGPRRAGTQPGRIDHESPCGSRWAGKPIAAFAVARKPQ